MVQGQYNIKKMFATFPVLAYIDRSNGHLCRHHG